MNNGRQLYLAPFQMANDGAATGDVESEYVGDYAPPLADLQAFVNKVAG